MRVNEGKIGGKGGSKSDNKEVRLRDCRNDVIFFNVATDAWTKIKTEGSTLEPRRYHSAVAIGKTIVVYGGLTSQNVYLGDFMGFTVTSLVDKYGIHKPLYTWSPINCKGEKPGPLACHTCQFVIHPERLKCQTLISLNNLPEIRVSRYKVLYVII